MFLGVPSICIIMTGTCLSAARGIISGSKRKELISLIISAPASRAARETCDFVESIEIRVSVCFLSADITGTTRLDSSSAITASEPGRVLSPPISRISAPSAISFNPCSTALSLLRNRPPSENESGVTFSTPIIQDPGLLA